MISDLSAIISTLNQLFTFSSNPNVQYSVSVLLGKLSGLQYQIQLGKQLGNYNEEETKRQLEEIHAEIQKLDTTIKTLKDSAQMIEIVTKAANLVQSVVR